MVLGVVQAKMPAGVEEPPVNVEDASVWPGAIPLATGQADMLGVAFAIVTLTVPVAVV
jgi:hypothetical protein